MRDIDIVLIFPPLAYENTLPDMGLPMLTAKLKEAGIVVEQDDLNVRLIEDYWINLQEIEWLKRNLSESDAEDEDLLYFMPQDLTDSRLFFDTFSKLPAEVIERLIRTERSRGYMVLYMYKRKLLAKSHYVSDLKEYLRAGDAFLEEFFQRTFFEKYGPKIAPVVGLSIWSAEQLYPALVLSKMIKEVSPKTHVVWGGIWATNADFTIISNLLKHFECVDSVGRYEFVHIIESLVRAVESGNWDSLAKVPNVIFRKSDGSIVQTEEIGPPPYEELPVPDFTGMPLDLYMDRSLPVMSARNCWWGKCVFCYHKLNPKLVHYQQRPVEQVHRDISQLVARTGFTTFYMADPSTHKNMIMKLSDRLMTEGPMVKLHATVRSTGKWSIDVTRMAAMGGLSKVYLGLESASKEKLLMLRKGITLENLERDLESFSRAGVMTGVFVLDFPTQTEEEFRQTLQWILDRHSIIDFFIAFKFRLGRNSMVFHHPEIMGITSIDPNADMDLNVYDHKYTTVHELSFRQFFDIRAEYMRNFMKAKGITRMFETAGGLAIS